VGKIKKIGNLKILEKSKNWESLIKWDNLEKIEYIKDGKIGKIAKM